MKNIHEINSTASTSHAFGIVAQHLMNNDLEISYSLQIDTIKKKLAVVGTFNAHDTEMFETSTAVKFEWNFQE